MKWLSKQTSSYWQPDTTAFSCFIATIRACGLTNPPSHTALSIPWDSGVCEFSLNTGTIRLFTQPCICTWRLFKSISQDVIECVHGWQFGWTHEVGTYSSMMLFDVSSSSWGNDCGPLSRHWWMSWTFWWIWQSRELCHRHSWSRTKPNDSGIITDSAVARLMTLGWWYGKSYLKPGLNAFNKLLSHLANCLPHFWQNS